MILTVHLTYLGGTPIVWKKIKCNKNCHIILNIFFLNLNFNLNNWCIHQSQKKFGLCFLNLPIHLFHFKRTASIWTFLIIDDLYICISIRPSTVKINRQDQTCLPLHYAKKRGTYITDPVYPGLFCKQARNWFID